MLLTVDSTAPLLRILREQKLCIDPRFRGELIEFYRNPGLRMTYFDKVNGLTIDGFGEALLDRGYVLESPTEREVIDLLDSLLSTFSGKASSRKVETEANAEGRALELELRKARANRQRAWICDCGETLIRSGRLTLRLTCGYCAQRVYRIERTAAEILRGISLSTIQALDYQPAATDESVPF